MSSRVPAAFLQVSPNTALCLSKLSSTIPQAHAGPRNRPTHAITSANRPCFLARPHRLVTAFAAAAVAAAHSNAPVGGLLTRHMSMSAADRNLPLLQDFSIETTPKSASAIPDHSEILPSGTRVYVAAIPGTPREDMTALCARLGKEGMVAVPHLAARALSGREELHAWLHSFRSVGVERVLLLAGDTKTPAGEFTSSMDVLKTNLLQHQLAGIDIVGHPEGSANIPDDPLKHMRDKVQWARENNVQMDILTQVCFNSSAVADYCLRLRQDGISNTLRVGMAGPTKPSTLIKYAMACGVGPSISLLQKNSGTAFGLMTQRQTPDGLLNEISTAVNRSPAGSDAYGDLRLHLFSFGGFAATANWARDTAAAQADP